MKRILIIDDEAPLRDTLALVLQTAGYETLTAESGEAGLALARAHLPDLTFCDVNMPVMDGKAVVRAFRHDPDLATRQIVIITGNATQTTQRTAMNIGADDYLTKPFTAEAVLKCAETRLERAELHRRMEQKVLHDLRTSLHSTLPHEFFTPLVGIIGMSELLMEEAGELSPAEITELAGNIHLSGERLHRTLRNYLRILELDQSPRAPAAAPLSVTQTDAILNKVAHAIATRHKRTSDLSLQVGAGQPRVDADTLEILIEEVVDNAFGYSRPGTPVRVEFCADSHSLVLRIHDQGRGLSEEQIEKIGAFRQFDRKRYEQQGLGLGLALVTRLLQQCGGRFSLQSHPGEGTTATLTLPAGAGT